MPGTQAYRDKPGYSVTDLPLGVGRVIKGVKDINNEKYLSGAGNLVGGVAEFGVQIASLKGGRTTNNKQLFTATEDFSLAKFQKAINSYNTTKPVVPSPVSGSSKVSPFTNKFPSNQTPTVKVSPFINKAIADMKFPLSTTPVPSKVSPFTNSKSPVVTSPPVTSPKPVVTSPPVTQPPAAASKTKTTSPPVTVPKPVTTTPTTVPSPPSTLPMTYDKEGNRLNKFVQPDEGYKRIRPGDPKPTKPKGAPGKADSPSEQRLDYEFRLEDWNKFNPKRK